MASGPSITITQIEGYKFTVDFGALIPDLLVDESVPISAGEGPFPEQLLIASVTNCLCASMVFALGKYRQEAHGIRAEATCRVERNPEGRLRIYGIDVAIALGSRAEDVPRIDRVLAQFERFCTVSESVKAGIPVSVAVRDAAGERLR
ncbi:OsmC family protein [Methylobacterium oxalidis]|uniref:Peroxiredoxin n=1 Tax=Methylobacterium oxalidis TaxID=944322 RepID=A0A512J6J8_9HYPH|nr:OsmC family protein [Methylobacterium oxalidis]GEP05530.1 hypothetical protein MOX02_35680 [Methylobacterium oxalidis]GJE31058.1 hypothetical protein LDDCCGHA_1230 [Methylobacterium oxalidis]GLS65577.1 hypothetical protein GCM10007888_39590 [Methylobacterium oxalidis]